jgi:hypothetical protein
MSGLLVTLLLLPRPVLSGPESIADTADGAFRIHYTLSGVDVLAHGATDVSPMNGIPDDVDAVIYGVARVRARWVDRAGMRAPLGDKGVGGSDSIDVYLRALGGPRGFTHPEDVGRAPAASAWIELEPQTALEPTDEDSRLAAAAGHEAHHAIQYAYSTVAEKWIYEASAAFVEHSDFVSTPLRAETESHYATLIAHPETPLDTFDGSHEYDELAFVDYAVGGGRGDVALAGLWDDLANGRTVLGSAGGALAMYGFGVWLWDCRSYLFSCQSREPSAGVAFSNTFSAQLRPRALLFVNADPALHAVTVSLRATTDLAFGNGGQGLTTVSGGGELSDPRMMLFATGDGDQPVELSLTLAPSVVGHLAEGCAVGGAPRIQRLSAIPMLALIALGFRARRRGGRARP